MGVSSPAEKKLENSKVGWMALPLYQKWDWEQRLMKWTWNKYKFLTNLKEIKYILLLSVKTIFIKTFKAIQQI